MIGPLSGIWILLGVSMAYMVTCFFVWCLCMAAGKADRFGGSK